LEDGQNDICTRKHKARLDSDYLSAMSLTVINAEKVSIAERCGCYLCEGAIIDFRAGSVVSDSDQQRYAIKTLDFHVSAS
jgi:hypothetical protein